MTKDLIRAAIQIAQDKRVDSVVSVSELPVHPRLATRISTEGTLLDFAAPVSEYIRRQDGDKYYAVNGALYLIRRDFFLQCRSLVPPGTYAYVMPRERSLDVDTQWDLHLADLILRNRRVKSSTDACTKV